MSKYTPHGFSRSRLYQTYYDMKFRCTRKLDIEYSRYGGAGVIVLFTCFEDFAHWALSNGYKDNLTIDRIDGGISPYSRDNCRWFTRAEQARNRKNNINITHPKTGETMCAAEWSRRLGGTRMLVAGRLKQGWDEQRAIMTPLQGHK